MTDKKLYPTMKMYAGGPVEVEPHVYIRRPWHFGVCDYCFSSKKQHPTSVWARVRPKHDNRWRVKDV